MIWLIEFTLVAVCVAVFAVFMNKQVKKPLNELAEARVRAYMETIRRTQEPVLLNAMSDVELTDILTNAVRHVAQHRNNRLFFLGIVAVQAIIISIILASYGGIQSFVIGITIGALVGYGLDRIMSRQILVWSKHQQLDMERLTLN